MSVCELCGGIWLNNQGSSRIIAALQTDAVRVAKEAAQSAMASAPTEQLINCPVCALPMERTSAGTTSVVVDRCAKHGTWFDRNELIQASNLAEMQRQARGSAPAAAPTAPAATGQPQPGPPRPGSSSGELMRNILKV